MVIFFIILLSLSGILLGALHLAYTEKVQTENLRMESYLLSMQVLYEALQERIDATRRYRHDLAKHLRTLDTVQAGDSRSQSKYGTNELIRALLQIMEETCQTKGIPFCAKVQDVSYAFVQDADMVSLLYNLLDNALEANERIHDDQKGIEFFMGMQNGQIVLQLENRIAEGESVDFSTKKPDADEHGFGMRIIGDIVKKYNGTQTIQTDRKIRKLYQKIVLDPCTGEV